MSDRASAQARLEAVRLVSIDGAVAHLQPVSRAHASRVRSGVKWFEDRLAEAAGRRVRVVIDPVEAVEPEAPDAAMPEMEDAALRREAETDPAVRTAMDLFQARVVRVERDTPGSGENTDA